MAKELNVLAVSYAKRTLEKDSREQKRMQAYAKVLDQFVIIVFTRKKDTLPAVYTEGNLTIYGTNARTRIGMLCRAYIIGRKILKEDTQKKWVISSQDPFATSIVGRALARARQCVHHVQVHGDPFSPQAQRSLFQRMWNIFGIQTLQRASAIRTVSARAKESLITRRIPSKNIHVLPIQHELTPFLLVGEQRQYAQNNTITFLYVGRLSSEKKVEHIIEAFALAYLQNPSIRLRIVGEGALLHTLKALSQQRGVSSVVTFIPWMNDVSDAMAQADVLVLASAHEGYGMVLVEAMAAGLPIVTTDVGCVGDVVLPTQHALVVPHNDIPAYAQALIQFSSDTAVRNEYGRRAHTDIQESLPNQTQYIKQWKDSFVGE